MQKCMAFSLFSDMIDIPCEPTCERRSPTCHGTCEDYKRYCEDKDKEKARRAKEGAVMDFDYYRMRSMQKKRRNHYD